MPQQRNSEPAPVWNFHWNFDWGSTATAAFRLADGWTVLVTFRVEDGAVRLADVQVAYSGDLPMKVETGEVAQPFAEWLTARVDACAPTVGHPDRELTARRLDGIRFGGLVKQARDQLTPAYVEYALGVNTRPRRLRVGEDVERDLARLAVRFDELQTKSRRPLADLAKEEGATYSAVRARVERARLLGLLTRPGKGQRGTSRATERAKGLI